MGLLYQIYVPKSTALNNVTPFQVIQLPIRRIRKIAMIFPNGPKTNLKIRLTSYGIPLFPQFDQAGVYLNGDSVTYLMRFKSQAAAPKGEIIKDGADDASVKVMEGPTQPIEVWAYNLDAANDWYVMLEIE